MNTIYRIVDGKLVPSSFDTLQNDEHIISLDNVNRLLSGQVDRLTDSTLVHHYVPKVIVSRDLGFRVNLEVLDNMNVVKNVSLMRPIGAT